MTDKIFSEMFDRFLSEIVGGQGSAGTDASSDLRFVDLGLPSGTLWAERDVEEPTMAGCSLPSYAQAQELIECCDFFLGTDSDGRSFYRVQGPNGQYVHFPIKEYEGTPGPSGCCWCAGEPNADFGYFLLLSKITITIGAGRRDMGFPYRMIRAK